MERALRAELTEHLGYAPHAAEGRGSGTARNGRSAKTGQTAHGELQVPRDRQGSFEPILVPKRQRRLEGFVGTVLALYARGLTTRDMQGHLEELYGVEVSPTLIATITDAVVEDVRIWQSRPVDAVHPIVSFACLFVKSRQEGVVKHKAVSVALGGNLQGEKAQGYFIFTCNVINHKK